MAASPQYIEGRGAADKKGARLRRGLCRKVVFQGATGFWPEDGGIAFGHALSGVRVQRVQKVQRVQRVVVSPSRAMNIKSALRDLLLFNKCCMAKS